LEVRLKIEGERCFLLKADVHNAIFRGEGQFYIGNDLAFDLREPENFSSSAGTGSFIGSQLRPPVVRLVRAAFVLQARTRPAYCLYLCFGVRAMPVNFKLHHYPMPMLRDRQAKKM
jgi:hypothetical protein